MTEATTSAQNNLPYVETPNMPQITPQNDNTTLNAGQSLSNGGPNASTSVQIDNSSLAVADNTCNGPGFLVFQKSANTINNATSTSVPVLVCISRYMLKLSSSRDNIILHSKIY